jgi:endonuclease YncB( thermonuclease family)
MRIVRPQDFVISNTMYETIMGSVAYGVSDDTSDFDTLGFCIPPKDTLFPHLAGEIEGFGRLFLSKKAWHTFKGYAHSQLHEMDSKNPEPGSKRAALREKYGFDVKFAYHLIRLIGEVEQILVDGDIDLRRNREQLKSIRRGEIPVADIRRMYTEKERGLERLYHSTDGDTVRVDAYLGMDTTRRVTIRLQGIDAWEMRNKPRGPKAREFVVQWCAGRKLKLQTYNDAPDKYGRTLGIIVRDDGQVLNEELVKHGHAIEKDWKPERVLRGDKLIRQVHDKKTAASSGLRKNIGRMMAIDTVVTFNVDGIRAVFGKHPDSLTPFRNKSVQPLSFRLPSPAAKLSSPPSASSSRSLRP